MAARALGRGCVVVVVGGGGDTHAEALVVGCANRVSVAARDARLRKGACVAGVDVLALVERGLVDAR